MPAPDIASIDEDKHALEQAWAATHAQWAEIDTFTDGTYEVWSTGQQAIAPRNTERTNRGRSLLDHISDNILPYKPKLERDKVVSEDAPDGQVDPVEEVASAIWEDASQGQMILPAKAAGRYGTKYNYFILEAGFLEAGGPQQPERDDPLYEAKMRAWEEAKWNYNPFTLNAPHPYTVLLPPRSRIPELAVRRMRWYRADLRKYLDAKREAKEDNLVSVADYEPSGNGYELVDVVEHFTPEYISLTAADVGSDLVLQEENLHLQVPFRHAWGGFGDMSASIDGMNPEKMGQGILWPVRDLIRQYDQIRSAKMELEMKAAYGLLVTAGDRNRLVQQMGAGGSAVIGGVNIKDMGYLPIPQLPQFLADLEDRIDREIVEATIPRAAFGQREVGVDTVGVHAMMLSVSFKRFLETMEQLGFLVSQIVSLWFKMCASSGQTYTIRGHRLSPAMLGGNFHIRASFPMTDEAVRQQRIQQGAALVAQGLKSKKRHWVEDQMLDNVGAEEDQLLEEAVLADPILTTAMAEKKRRELGVADMYNEQLQRMAQERMAGFAETQAEAGLGGGNGFTPPITEAQGQVKQAEASQLLRPTPAGPGAGQRE